jgi:DNA gyrase subunit A
VVFAALSKNQDDIILFTAGSAENPARSIHFNLEGINPQATPTAKGMTAMKVANDKVASCVVVPVEGNDGFSVVATEKGTIERLPLSELPCQGRGGQGVNTFKITPATGKIVGSALAYMDAKVDVVMVGNKRVRIPAAEIAVGTRVAKGIGMATLFEIPQGIDVQIIGLRPV